MSYISKCAGSDIHILKDKIQNVREGIKYWSHELWVIVFQNVESVLVESDMILFYYNLDIVHFKYSLKFV